MKDEWQINAYVISHIGKVRRNLEDNFLLDNGNYINLNAQERISLDDPNGKHQYVEESYESRKSTSGIFAVCDGMGGCNSGEIASYIAVRSLADYKDKIVNSPDIKTSIDYYQEYVYMTNKAILDYCNSNPESRGMGTTLVSLLIKDNAAAIINLGDSSAFIYKDNQLRKISKTHTEGQRLVDLKIVSENELIGVKSRNALTRYLGMDEKIGIPLGDISDLYDIGDKQYFILCSDGLTDCVTEDKINEMLNRNEQINIVEVANLLLREALIGIDGKNGGADNITVLLVEVRKLKKNLFIKFLGEYEKVLRNCITGLKD